MTDDDPFIKIRVAPGVTMVINGIGEFVYLAGLHRDPTQAFSLSLSYILSELDIFLTKNKQPRFSRTITVHKDDNLVYLEGGTGIKRNILREFRVEIGV